MKDREAERQKDVGKKEEEENEMRSRMKRWEGGGDERRNRGGVGGEVEEG